MYHYVLGAWILVKIHEYSPIIHFSWSVVKGMVSLGKYMLIPEKKPDDDDMSFILIFPE